MVAPGRWFTHRLICTLKLLTAYVHRSTLPQSRPLGVPAPSEREPGGLAPFIGVLAKIRGYGRFSSPLRNSDDFGFYHSSKYTPSVSHSLDSSLREGAGNGCVPFNVQLRNRNVAGDFHRPYETQIFLPPKNFRFLPGERYRVGQGTHRIGTNSKRN